MTFIQTQKTRGADAPINPFTHSVFRTEYVGFCITILIRNKHRCQVGSSPASCAEGHDFKSSPLRPPHTLRFSVRFACADLSLKLRRSTGKAHTPFSLSDCFLLNLQLSEICRMMIRCTCLLPSFARKRSEENS
jgi:hypothetical protein